ncbi:putative ribonuclease H-like domain-containing protein [Tanacetum coccineum]
MCDKKNNVLFNDTEYHLGKFDGKADEGFFIGYSINSKAFRVFNSRTRIVEENLHVQFSENAPNIESVLNGNAGTKACDDAGKMETVPGKDYILLPLWPVDSLLSQSSKSSLDEGFKPSGDDEKKIIKERLRWCSEKEQIIKTFKIDYLLAFLSKRTPKKRGKIDKTLFIRRDKGDIMLVQVYVDDIIFGSTKKLLCTEFEKMMHKKFQMSFIGELTFFLGLQVKQKEDGIFISQDKYVTEILKKFGFSNVKTTSTPMETQKPLLKDEDGEEVDVHLYRSMIGSLMYLTSSRPDIIARSRLWLLIPQLKLNSSCFKLLWPSALDLKSIVKTDNREVQLQALVDRKKIIITESTIRRDLQLEDAEGIDCLPNAAIFEQLTLMGMVKNVDIVNKFLLYPRFVQMFVNQQAGHISNHKRNYVTPSYTKKVFRNMKREGKCFSKRVAPLFPAMMKDKPRKPKKKDTQIPQSSVPSDNIVEEAINEENVPTHSNDPLLSCEDRLKLEEMMALCTNLQNRVLDLEHTKTTQALEIDRLKRRVKKLEKKQRSRTYELRRLYKGRKIHDIDADEDITLDSTHFDTDLDMFGVHDLDMFGVHVFDTDFDTEEPVVNASTTTSTILTVTTAATTTTTDVTRTKAKGLTIQEQEQVSSSKDKGKGIMVKEPLKMKKKDQVLFDEQEAIRLQAQFDEEARIDKIEPDYELAQRLQAEEQEELTIEEKSKLFQQLIEKRRKHFAAKRAEERRNRPPTNAQQISIMCTYLKNMAGWKPKDLKTKSFANVQELFDKAMKMVNIFVDMDT